MFTQNIHSFSETGKCFMEISIALCSFNGSHFLSDQLNSIKFQTRRPDEVIICDDCSNDETLSLLYAFKEECSFSVQVYSNITRLGSIKNFEKVIGFCKGDIVVLADQDDVWVPEKLAIIEYAFEENPDVGYLFTDAELVDADGGRLGLSLWDSLGFTKNLISRFKNGEQLSCLFKKPIVTGATMAIRGTLKQYVLPIPENTILVHDLWIALVASSISMVGMPLSDKLIKYRLHPSQQIGIRPSSLVALYKDVMAFDKNNFKEFIEAFEYLIDRLLYIKKTFNIEVTDSIDQIKQKNLHLNNRFSIHSTQTYIKYRLIIREIFSGGYSDYSDSWKSAIRDLFTRPF